MTTHVDAEQLALLQYMVPGSTVDDIVSSKTTSSRRRAARRVVVGGDDDDNDAAATTTTQYDVVEGKGKQPTIVAVVASSSSSSASGAAAAAAAGSGGGGVADGGGSGANTQQAATSLLRCQPTQHTHSNAKVLRRIRVDERYRPSTAPHDEHAGDGDDDDDDKDDDDDSADDFVSGGGGGGGGSGAARANQRVLNELRELTFQAGRAGAAHDSKRVDRSERATSENVMDPRTRLLLYKLVNTGVLREINGCVSTGKEANVYYAVCGDGSAAAVKVFKTSILVFRDRDAYVAGEFRFQRYCKTNPRKMICTWAEKEARNLMRLQSGGVLAPAVKLLRQHVLVMEFLGEDGWPAPRLKEVRFPSPAALDHCYLDLCCTMRKMYARCKLIHGDLSEYNLLLFRGRVVVIDVSQSVEGDHPRAMDFLRRDIVNVHAFFRARGHAEQLLSHQDLFQFVTSNSSSGSGATSAAAAATSDGTTTTTRGKAKGRGKRKHGKSTTPATATTTDGGTDDNTSAAVGGDVDEEQAWMAQLLELRARRCAARARACDADTEQAEVDEQVFLRIHVPRTLKEIADDKAPNAELAPFVHDMTADAHGRAASVASSSSSPHDASDDNDGSDEQAGDNDGDDDDAQPEAGVLAEMTRDERKAHKKAVKEANRERRVQKKLHKAAHKKHR